MLKFPLNKISVFDKLSCKEWDNWQSLKLLTFIYERKGVVED